MTRKIVISPGAQTDISSIWHYTCVEHGGDAADAYIRDLDQTMQMVCEFPAMGVDCSDVRRGYRRIGSGSHLIYYIVGKSEITVIRVLHARQDAKSRLG